MLTISLGFVLTGLTEELLTYGYETNPGAGMPFLGAAAWLTNWVFFTAIGPILLLLDGNGALAAMAVPSPGGRASDGAGIVAAISSLGGSTPR